MMNSAHRFMPGPAIKSNGGIECDLMLASNEPPSREDAPRQLRLTSDHLLARFSTIGWLRHARVFALSKEFSQIFAPLLYMKIFRIA